jgi:sugar phosphate isomerase/epimerase
MKGISAMAFYENMLTANAEERAFYHNHFKELVPASEKLGVKLIGLFPGRNQNLSVEGSLVEYGKVFPDMVKFAGDHGRKAMYEPCPMEWWVIDPKTGKPHRIGNIAYCPENWRRINEMTPDMGINMDFSHLIWQNIDYLRAANEFGNHIVHVHGKDARLLEGVRKVKNGLVYVDSPHAPDSTLDNSFEKGLFRDDWPVEGWGAGLYEHAIPGEGDLSWEEIVKALKGNGYSGPISVELEASKYKPREDPELSKVGMIRSRNHLLQFV